MRLGQQANPHPSGDSRYVTEVVAEDDEMVRVRYITGTTAAWWVTASAWDDWVRLADSYRCYRP